MSNRQEGDSQSTASAKAGISERTGRRIESGQRTARAPRNWRTRKDPLEEIWESVLVPMLVKEPELTGLTLWEHLDEIHPGKYPPSLLRTLQRRVKHYLATDGPPKTAMIRQSVPPGHQGLSDFTHPDTPITIGGEPFPHLLYQFRLAYSGWRSVLVCGGGESYSALADGLQNALHKLGGTPAEHRTDSLSAAYITTAEHQRLTASYEALCEHYGMRPTVNNRSIAHENGAIETAHRSLKHRIAQAIKVRGSADFPNVNAYRSLLFRIVEKLNRRSQERLLEEREHLASLPSTRFIDYSELTARVTTSSTITVKRCRYSVPSQLIGERIRIHLYHDRLDCFVAQRKVATLTRVYAAAGSKARRIDYRHIIHSLAAKPQSFRFAQLRDDLLPSESYRELWARADAQFDPKSACKWMVTVLRFAHDHDCERTLAAELLQGAKGGTGELIDLKQLQGKYLRRGPPPAIPVRQHDAAQYDDDFLSGTWARPEVSCG